VRSAERRFDPWRTQPDQAKTDQQRQTEKQALGRARSAIAAA
jgi:hypothetical protein